MQKKLGGQNYSRIMGFCFIFALACSSAYARDRGGKHDHGHGREVVVVGQQRYNYHDGRFFRPSWFGFEFSIFSPPIGAVVKVLPFGYRTISARGRTYYYHGNIYYTACPSGYIVVPGNQVVSDTHAIAVVQNQFQSGQALVINVPNSNGSYTSVTLLKRNNGYVGPQGEYYDGNPTVEQLKALYGK